MSGLKDEKLIKRQTYMKTETCKLYTYSSLESFAYFCQLSSKSIPIILSYIVSKLVHFWRHSVDFSIDRVVGLTNPVSDGQRRMTSRIISGSFTRAVLCFSTVLTVETRKVSVGLSVCHHPVLCRNDLSQALAFKVFRRSDSFNMLVLCD